MKAADESRGSGLDAKAATGAGAVIGKLAGAAKQNGPVAFGLGAGVGLPLIGLLLLAGSRIDRSAFILVLIAGAALSALAGSLALLEHRTQARIAARDLEANEREIEDAREYLNDVGKQRTEPLL